MWVHPKTSNRKGNLMHGSWLEQNGLIVALLAFVAVMFVAIFLMVLISFLNSRRARENSDRLLVNEAAKVVAEKKKSAAAVARADEAERLYRSDIAMIQTQVQEALRAMRVGAHRPTLPPTVEHFSTLEHSQARQSASLGWTSTTQNGQAVGTVKALNAPQTRPAPRPLKALPVAEVAQAPEMLDAQPHPPVDEYAYTPTEAFMKTPKAPEEVPHPAEAAWFVEPEEQQNGDLHDSTEREDELPASLVADDPAVQDVGVPGTAGGRDDGSAEEAEPRHGAHAAVGDAEVQEDEPVGPRHLIGGEDAPQEQAVPADEPPPAYKGVSGIPDIVPLVGAKDFEETLSNIKRTSLFNFGTETDMKPVTVDDPNQPHGTAG